MVKACVRTIEMGAFSYRGAFGEKLDDVLATTATDNMLATHFALVELRCSDELTESVTAALLDYLKDKPFNKNYITKDFIDKLMDNAAKLETTVMLTMVVDLFTSSSDVQTATVEDYNNIGFLHLVIERMARTWRELAAEESDSDESTVVGSESEDDALNGLVELSI